MEVFNLTIDSKVTVWKRDEVSVEAESLDEAIKLAKDGDYSDIFESEYLYDTEEPLDPIDNSGFTTIEIMDENGNTIWENGNR